MINNLIKQSNDNDDYETRRNMTSSIITHSINLSMETDH